MTESQNIEYKSSWRDEYLKWICGFANSNGGSLFVGVDDNAKVIGIEKYEELMTQLPNKFRDVLGVFAEINLHHDNNKHFLEIIIPRYDVPISLRGKYYIRSGSTLQELKGPALNEFIMKRTGKTWDDVMEQRASIDDIDETSIKQFLKDARKAKRINVEDDIESIDLLDKLRLIENKHLKRAAIILFGKDPARFYPNLSVKIGKFGESDADLKHHEVLEGNLIQLQKGISEMLNAKFFIHPIDFIGMQRVEKDEFPVAAVREMILNALVHRNYLGSQTQIRLYEDQFSIWNDGGLPEGITEEDLKKVHRSKPRNPLIADTCFKAGYIDSWGRGTIKIIEACKEFGLKEPILKEEQGGFLSMLLKEKVSYMPNETQEIFGINSGYVRDKFGKTAQMIVEEIIKNKFITIPEISKKLGVTSRTIEKHIAVLKKSGILKRVGSRKKGHWKINP